MGRHGSKIAQTPSRHHKNHASNKYSQNYDKKNISMAFMKKNPFKQTKSA
jgi:hypothetical protein